MSSNFREYPKKMSHPEHADAVFKPLTEEQQKLKGLFAPVPELLSPMRYPEVTVTTLEQEKQYASKGYRPNNMGNAEDYERAMLDAQKPASAFAEFPKWKYHPINAPCIVKDAAEESALGEGWHDAPVQATEDDLPKDEKLAKVASKPKAKAKAKAKGKENDKAKTAKTPAKKVAQAQPIA